MIDLERLLSRFRFLGVPFTALPVPPSTTMSSSSSSSSSEEEESLYHGSLEHVLSRVATKWLIGISPCTYSLLVPTACHRGIFRLICFCLFIRRGGGEYSSSEWSSSSDVSSDTTCVVLSAKR